MIDNLTVFSDVRIFLCFCNDIVMTSFLVIRLSNLHIYEKSYQNAKLKGCRLSGSSFTEKLQKHNDDVIMTSFHTFGIQNFHMLLKLIISYQTAKFQIPESFESNFIKVSIRKKPKKTISGHYDVTSQYLIFKIAHFVELNRNYQPAKFYWSRCRDQLLRGVVENSPPSDLHSLKK